MSEELEHTIYLALGSNLGDRSTNLRNAIQEMSPEVQVISESAVYETPPWGYADQPPFLNQVIKAKTDLSPIDLLHYLKELEVKLGRQPTFNYGPRQIDIDILIYDQLIYNSPELKIPHPRLSERAFVLVPLVDLAPDLLHPISGSTMRQLLSKVDASKITVY